MTPRPFSRRGFLVGLGALAGAAGLAACSNEAPPGPPAPGAPPSPTTTTSTDPAAYEGEVAWVALGAALSGLAGDLLGQAATGAGQGRFGAVPAVVSAYLSGAAAQHVAHAEAWNRLLTAGGRPAVTGYPLTVEPALRERLDAARAPVDLLGLAADLTGTVAATVTRIVGEVTDASAVTLAAGVGPVVAMHGATADFLLGRPPTAPTDPIAGALTPDALTV
ncbi:ferritin-like domain-containing protein [Actinomycetospora lemnae]|uniref:Ferritin-like domain-containing protein n=1 Tax=Actinomycetospora lemnae TaxID=3019891 RepID=A0ABT5STB6_9PSEU|nr:ferritin-like domain-containing protein [Actinomycetospora sp. DW7H6]MDD7965931.1 ferritin-like domain-containing protein [Actinomycetospora sp. DW7H6]